MKIILRDPHPIRWLLSVLFPPRLPGKIEDWVSPDTDHLPLWIRQRMYTPTPNTARPAKLKYGRLPWRAHANQFFHQMLHAQEEVAKLERSLAAQGYVNTIHDCWEKPEKSKSA